MKTMQSKTCIFSFFLLLSSFFISGHAASMPSAGVQVFRTVFVDPKPGKANFTTIAAALAAAPSNLSPTTGYYVISIAKGVYNEYIVVPYDKKYVMMLGSGIGRTIITGSKSVADGIGTYDTATFAAIGQGFVAKKITFRNTAGAAKQQAVALRNSAQNSAFHLCSFEGYQATLYAHSMQQFYKQCDIYGTVDAIFGNAVAIFQNSNIYPRVPLPGQFNTVTAQARSDPTQDTGFIFQRCNFIAPAPAAAQAKTYLGRPWGLFSRTVVMQSVLGPLIHPAGWAPWSGLTGLSTLYYAEYANTGLGSSTVNRVAWPGYRRLSAKDAEAFTVKNFLLRGNDWLTGTKVPFIAGL